MSYDRPPNDRLATRVQDPAPTIVTGHILAKLHERTRADAVLHATQSGVLTIDTA